MRVGHRERLVPVSAARVVVPPRLGALQLPARTLLLSISVGRGPSCAAVPRPLEALGGVW